MKQGLILILTTLLLLTGCNNGIKGDGDVVFESVDVGSFNQVSITSNIDAEIISGQHRAVSIRAEANLIQHIEFETEYGLLTIRIKKGVTLANTHPIMVYITVPELRYLRKHGPSLVVVKGLNQSVLEAYSEGSGELILQGKTNKLTLKRVGSGSVNAKDLNGNSAEINNYGSGNIVLGSFKRLKPIIQGQGDIICPEGTLIFDEKYTGGGQVKKVSME